MRVELLFLRWLAILGALALAIAYFRSNLLPQPNPSPAEQPIVTAASPQGNTASGGKAASARVRQDLDMLQLVRNPQ